MVGAYHTLTYAQEAPMKPREPLKTKRRVRMEAAEAAAKAAKAKMAVAKKEAKVVAKSVPKKSSKEY
jgi:hypothetical protein